MTVVNRRLVAVAAAGLVLLAGARVAATSWSGSGQDDVATAPEVPLSVAAPAALAVAELLHAPAAASPLEGTSACHVQGVVRCWAVPGDFATVNAAVVADLADAGGVTPEETWSSGPEPGFPGRAARTSVEIAEHRVQVEVYDQLEGRRPDVVLTGVQTVLVEVDPA